MNLTKNISLYITELYEDKTLSANYVEQLAKMKDVKIVERPYGFATYLMLGDCAAILDMWVRPSARSRGYAWKLHDYILKEAKIARKNVMITFSGKKNQKRYLGLSAIEAAGFKPAYELKNSTMFIKGI